LEYLVTKYFKHLGIDLCKAKMTAKMANCAQRLDRNSNFKRMGESDLECEQKMTKCIQKAPSYLFLLMGLKNLIIKSRFPGSKFVGKTIQGIAPRLCHTYLPWPPWVMR
jgi:hypothetical protein